MDAQQALADLTEVSSQIQTAVVFDDNGKVVGSTATDVEPFARAAADLLAAAEDVNAGSSALAQLEVSTTAGSVFVVREGKTTIAATTAPAPTVGLVFYDLKSALRSLKPKPPPKPRPKPDAKGAVKPKPKPKAKTGTKKPPARPRKKPDAS
jgi:predicted regulator of Ras-like GTPase activity (Roadblock/LC7/MglB family)